MAAGYPSWTGAARALAIAIDTAVSSARDGDADGFGEALIDLRRGEAEVVSELLGTVTQQLIERTYPDGLDSDDAAALLDDAAGSAAWYERLDRDHLAVALIAALGMHDPSETPDVDPSQVTAHGLLLIAALLPSARELPALVDSALRELHRAQTVEMP